MGCKPLKEINHRTCRAEYNSWRGMKDRCLNPNHSQYRDYGGRGLTICDRWIQSFVAFYEDMGPKPVGTTLERRDNTKGYDPDNCRWATRIEQAQNKRNNRVVEFEGRSMCVAAWETELGFPPHMLVDRLHRGWSVRRALTTPAGAPAKTTRWVTIDGETKPLATWARDLGIAPSTLRGRLRQGKELTRAA